MKSRGLSLSLWSLLFLCVNAAELLCNTQADIYGHVDKDKAAQLVQFIPFYGKPEAQADFKSPRVFAEPGFFDPRFSAFPNPTQHGLEMAQMPRLWKKGSASMALLTWADVSHNVHVPWWISSWEYVSSGAEALAMHCARENVGGVFVFRGYAPHDPQAFERAVSALYLYQAGSPFEELLNRYMLHNYAINPYNPSNKEGLSVDGTLQNIAVPGISPQDGIVDPSKNQTEPQQPISGAANTIEPLRRRRRQSLSH